VSEGTNEGLSVRCPECNRRLKVPAKLAGKRVPCPACKAMLNLPKLDASPTNNPPAVPLKSLDDDLDDIGFKLSDEAPKSTAKASFAAEHLGFELAEIKANLQEKEYSYPCKVCGSMMYAKPSDVGSMARCPDCYSEYSVPGPPPTKARPKEPNLNTIAEVALKPVQGSGKKTQEFGRSTAEDYLAKAEKEVAEDDQDEREQVYDFDSSGWLKRTFAFLGDSTLIIVALVTGLLMGVTMVASGMAGTAMPNASESARIFGIMLVLILFGVPLLIITLGNGIAVLESSANRLKRVAQWPIFNPSDAMGEIMVALLAFAYAVLPGGLLGWFGGSLGLNGDMRAAIVLLSAYALYPILLLGMLDNQSAGEPFSKDVLNSIRSKADAWGAMYLLTGLAMALIFLMYLSAVNGTELPRFLLGFCLPLIIFFIFHQLGVLGTRIADVTNLAFDGEESEAPEAAKDEDS
jgi:DNA-directed RNA polymerase subunit M/transcription elongation factor TFIIS